jgi:hypothetical protein
MVTIWIFLMLDIDPQTGQKRKTWNLKCAKRKKSPPKALFLTHTNSAHHVPIGYPVIP